MFEARLAQLEQRLAAAERELRGLRQQRRLLGGAALLVVLGVYGLVAVATSTAQGPDKVHTVKAPFIVVDAGGKPIMDIGIKGKRRLHLYDASGMELVGMGESNEGKSSATLLVGTGNNAVGLQNETGDKKGGFFYSNNGKVTVRLGELGLGIYDNGGKRIVHVGADTSGQVGIVNVGKAGKSLVQLTMVSEVGRVIVSEGDDSVIEMGKLGIEVFSKGKGIAHLGHSPSGSGAGYLALANKGGSAIVEAGMLPEGDGVVRAYPLSGRTPFPIPNFIRGGKSDK